MAKELKKTLKEVKVALSKSRSVVLVTPQFPTLDNAAATKLLINLFENEQNKPTKVLIPENYKLPERISEFVGYSKIPEENALHNIDPLAYTITVPEVDKDTQVSWEIEDGEFKIVLKPDDGEVDLSKAQFGTEGERYDLLITIGAQSKDMLNAAYQNSKDAVKNMVVVNIDPHSANTGFGNVNVVNGVSTATEIASELYKTIGAELTKENAELAMKATIVSTDGLRRISSSRTLKRVLEFEKKSDGKIAEMLKSHYLSLGRKGLNLREEMLKRIKDDGKGEILVSLLPQSVLNELGISAGVLEGVEQLPYNICKGVKVSALAYEVAEGSWKVLALANNESVNLFPWAKALGGTGVANIAVAPTKGDEETAAQTIIKTLKAEVFGVGAAEQTTKKQVITPPAPQKKETKTTEEETQTPFKKASEEELDEFAQESDKSKKKRTAKKSPFKKAKIEEEKE